MLNGDSKRSRWNETDSNTVEHENQNENANSKPWRTKCNGSQRSRIDSGLTENPRVQIASAALSSAGQGCLGFELPRKSTTQISNGSHLGNAACPPINDSSVGFWPYCEIPSHKLKVENGANFPMIKDGEYRCAKKAYGGQYYKKSPKTVKGCPIRFIIYFRFQSNCYQHSIPNLH